MTSRFRHELHRNLAASVDAADVPPPESSVETAQDRLLARMQGARLHVRPARMHWLAAGSAALLAIIVVAVPLLMDQGRAFATVQAHFRDFETLSMRVEQRRGGELLQSSHMVVNARGVLRTDVGDQISIIVDPVRERMLMLMHAPRQAMLIPLERQADASPQSGLEWLEEIREFKGQARPLETTRVIDGRPAQGWALEVDGHSLVLWADRSGLPLAMETGVPGGLEINYRFEFDAPVPAGHLSSEVPTGYQLAGANGE